MLGRLNKDWNSEYVISSNLAVLTIISCKLVGTVKVEVPSCN